MAFCGYCGAVMPDDMRFCTECGKPLKRKTISPESDSIQVDHDVNKTDVFKDNQNGAMAKGAESKGNGDHLMNGDPAPMDDLSVDPFNNMDAFIQRNNDAHEEDPHTMSRSYDRYADRNDADRKSMNDDGWKTAG